MHSLYSVQCKKSNAQKNHNLFLDALSKQRIPLYKDFSYLAMVPINRTDTGHSIKLFLDSKGIMIYRNSFCFNVIRQFRTTPRTEKYALKGSITSQYDAIHIIFFLIAKSYLAIIEHLFKKFTAWRLMIFIIIAATFKTLSLSLHYSPHFISFTDSFHSLI